MGDSGTVEDDLGNALAGPGFAIALEKGRKIG